MYSSVCLICVCPIQAADPHTAGRVAFGGISQQQPGVGNFPQDRLMEAAGSEERQPLPSCLLGDYNREEEREKVGLPAL